MPNSYGSWRTGLQIDNIYPIGCIYMSVSPTNPRNLFGGTWEQIQDTFLLCCGTTYTAGSTGGSATMAHTHSQVAVTTGGSSAANSGSTAISIAQMPAHNHGQATLTGQGRWRDFNMGDHNGLLSASGICSVGRNVSWSGNHDKFAVAGGQSNNLYNDLNINASHTHTTQGSGSGHTHTIAHTHDIAATTTGAASNTDNMPPYLAVYVFKRTA